MVLAPPRATPAPVFHLSLGAAQAPVVWTRPDATERHLRVLTLQVLTAVLGIRFRNRIWIRRICMFLGLPDPDPLVRSLDPAPAPNPSFFS